MITVLESYQCSKTGNKADMEDVTVVTEVFAAVIDGATNVSGRMIDGSTPGQHASRLVVETIQSLTGHEVIHEIIQLINRRFISFYKQHNMLEDVQKHPYLQLSATMVLYSHYYRRVWAIGDAQCLISGRYFQNQKIVDQITADARALLVEAELAKGRSLGDIQEDDRSFELIKPLIQSQYQFQNGHPDDPYSYSVINGFHIHKTSIVELVVQGNPIRLILASDGYPKLKETLEETEAFLTKCIQEDPLCIRTNKNVKGVTNGRLSYDDRSYLSLLVGAQQKGG
ncbi:hypothetical protein [Geomicrobium sp. JCM 19038]|uniref:hypothetical protein n=1 Tax=Geomicrobium sp. JCM 19038 TaxID=1460635 RepID=UPI00045F127C|nr:hypothetical protein [Geomicrobium sp. JCM 19038]GAK08099.1 hypothetical protein JCM19038_1866 [Geomicrobium sp. JCM 19038]